MDAKRQYWRAWIGLGANLAWVHPVPGATGRNSSPEETLQQAAQALGELGRVEAASGLWRTQPVGPVLDQPPFTNAAVLLQTSLSPEALLAALQALEQRFGRVRGPVAKGPRTLDLDLLLMERFAPGQGDEPGQEQATTPVLLLSAALTLPHPEVHRRRFVLAPLAEIAPKLCHPRLGLTIRDLLLALPQTEQVTQLPRKLLRVSGPGRLEVITGPMFAGKSEELIRKLLQAEDCGLRTVCFKPEMDTRAPRDRITSHNQQSLRALPVNGPAALRTTLSALETETDPIDVIGIDEAQFFAAALPEVALELVQGGRRVVIAGLDMTFAGEPFGPVPALMALADEVVKLAAECTVCGTPAVHSQRRGSARSTVLVGAADVYEARCRAHFYPAGLPRNGAS